MKQIFCKVFCQVLFKSSEMFSDWKKRLCKENLKPIIKEVVHDLPRLATVLLIEYRLKTPDNTLYITTPDKALFIESQCSAESETLSCFPATAGIVSRFLFTASLFIFAFRWVQYQTVYINGANAWNLSRTALTHLPLLSVTCTINKNIILISE